MYQFYIFIVSGENNLYKSFSFGKKNKTRCNEDFGKMLFTRFHFTYPFFLYLQQITIFNKIISRGAFMGQIYRILQVKFHRYPSKKISGRKSWTGTRYYIVYYGAHDEVV